MTTDDELYKNYVESHLKSRKTLPEKKDLKKNSKAFSQHFGNIIPKNKDIDILDIGCGYGILVWWLQEKGYKSVAGIDISDQQISLGKKLEIKQILKADGIEYLKESNVKYDVIFLRDVIEHIERQDLLSFLRHCCSALKEGGKLIVQTVNGTSPFSGDILYGDFTHKWAFTSSSISQLMTEAGFAKTRVHSWRPSYSGLSVIRYISWIFVEQFLRVISFTHGGKFAKVMTINLISESIK